MVNAAGRRVGGFSAAVFGRITNDRYLSLPRSALAAALVDAIRGDVELLYDTEIAAMEERGDGVQVAFSKGEARRFDLVVGADGLHSRVRELAFGEERRFEHYLGYQVAAFEVPGYRPRDEDVYVMYATGGRQVGRFALRGDRTMFLLTYADPSPESARDPAAQKRLLRERFEGQGWECDGILRELEAAPELYFDRVSQIRMPEWHRGRVVLIGDAAFCVSLLAGQGSALAMTAAYVLAGELKRAGGDPLRACAAYQALLGPFLAEKQAAAERFAGSFAPRTALGVYFRNRISRLLSIPFLADLFLSRDLRDTLELSDY